MLPSIKAIKVSYICMPNMGQSINKHNIKLSTRKQPQDDHRGCNCQGGLNSCPVDGACQTKGVVYQATALREDNGTKETYTGLTSRRFKDRYYEHRQDFKSEAREGTSLSNHVWKLKKKANKTHNLMENPFKM